MFPLKKLVTKENKCTKPWLTNELKKRCKKKNSLYKKYLLAPSSQKECSFKIFMNKMNKDIKNEKRSIILILYFNLLKVICRKPFQHSYVKL